MPGEGAAEPATHPPLQYSGPAAGNTTLISIDRTSPARVGTRIIFHRRCPKRPGCYNNDRESPGRDGFLDPDQKRCGNFGLIDRDHHFARLDDRVRRLTDTQPESRNGRLRDDRRDLLPAGEYDRYLGVHAALDDFLDIAFQDVSCTDLHGFTVF